MNLIGIINRWAKAPERCRHFFVPPVPIRPQPAPIQHAEYYPPLQ